MTYLIVFSKWSNSLSNIEGIWLMNILKWCIWKKHKVINTWFGNKRGKSMKNLFKGKTTLETKNIIKKYTINVQLQRVKTRNLCDSDYLCNLCKQSTSRLSIPYRTGRYGRNIPYWPAIRYARPLCFVPEKIPAIPASYRRNPTIPASYRPYWKKSLLCFFFLVDFKV